MLNKITYFFKRNFKYMLFSLYFILQIFIIYLLTSKLYFETEVFTNFVYVISVFLVLKIVYDDTTKASYKVSWITAFLLTRQLSIVLYLIFGKNKFPKSTKNKVASIKSFNNNFYTQNHSVFNSISNISHKNNVDLIFNLEQFPVYKNTNVQYLPSGSAFLEKLITQLKKAEKFIFMEYFIVSDGFMHNSIMNVLIEKANSGVDVRYLYDAGGSFATLPPSFKQQCLDNNIKLQPFRPLSYKFYSFFSYRDHKKITVIDGLYGFTGGINIGDEYINKIDKFGHWKDMSLFLEGDAVYSLTSIFLSTWNYATKSNCKFSDFTVPNHNVHNNCYVVPFEDTPVNTTDLAEDNYIKIISSAKKYVYITTPYLIINEHLSSALELSAKSGVDVRILTPHVPDKKIVLELTRSFYSKLTSSGVKIYEYTPGFIHGKIVVSDDTTSVVGTINFDYRSFIWNYECACVVFDETLALDIKKDFLETLEVSHLAKQSTWKNISLPRKIFYTFLKLLGPLI